MSIEELELRMNLQSKDVEALVESFLEHVSNLDDQTQLVVDSIIQGVEGKIREIVKQELANAQQDSSE